MAFPRSQAAVDTADASAGARFALRKASCKAHERVDALFSRFDLNSRHSYADFLRAQAGAHLAVEAALDRAGAGRLIADWEAQRRSPALRRDLDSLGVHDVDLMEAPAFDDEAAVWGGAYVLEGSRLGGALLRRSVIDDLPSDFLTPAAPGLWRGFVARLEEALYSSARIETAAAATLATFAVFETSARRVLETKRP